MENILRPYLPLNEQDTLNLSDDDCIYRAFYFNNIPEELAKEAIFLFPNPEKLWERYKKVLTPEKPLSSSELCDVVYDYLKSVAVIMEKQNLEEIIEALDFINNLDRNMVLPDEELKEFERGKNKLHVSTYSTLSNFIIDEMPDDDAYWILYEWAIEQGHVATDACYLLQGYFESEWARDIPLFDSALKLWQSGNFKRYWLDENTFTNEARVVYCNAA